MAALSRPITIFALALGLLGAAAVLAWMPLDVRPVSLAFPLEAIPEHLAGWEGSNHVPRDVLPVDGSASARLLRTYRSGTRTVWVSIDYYAAQREGSRPPAQTLLYPAHGWSELRAQSVVVPFAGAVDDGIPATLVLMRDGGRRVAVLYWYQIQGRSVRSDHWYRALLLYNRLTNGRGDGALVRVAVPVSDGDEPNEIVAQMKGFVEVFYAELRRALPH